MASPGLERFVHSSAGYRAVLRSQGVADNLQGRAERVKAAAESMDGSLDLDATTVIGRGRAGASVFGVPMKLEASSRILGRSIDAAR